MPQFREWSLTALVVIESIELFIIAPLAATMRVPVAAIAGVIAINVLAVLAIVWPNRIAIGAIVVATLLELAAVVLRRVSPTGHSALLDFAAALVLLTALTVVVGFAVFGPGRITVHRIMGAVAIYLNTALVFALAYRVVDALGPGRFSFARGHDGGHTIAELIYFSFTTLTTSGFGDIVPYDPFARSLTNIEAVIGQLFPATLLARLITLELEQRRTPRA